MFHLFVILGYLINYLLQTIDHYITLYIIVIIQNLTTRWHVPCFVFTYQLHMYVVGLCIMLMYVCG